MAKNYIVLVRWTEKSLEPIGQSSRKGILASFPRLKDAKEYILSNPARIEKVSNAAYLVERWEGNKHNVIVWDQCHA